MSIDKPSPAQEANTMQISDEMVEAFGNAFWSVNAASKIDGQREHIRSALEAALSTDAEPVAIYKGNGLADCGDSGHHNIELLKLIPANTPLYAEPVKTAPAVAVKALQFYAEYFEKDTLGDFAREALSAISAQVQDVAAPEGWQLVPKEPTEEMHNAARDWALKKYGLGIGFDGSDGCYRAMLAAAPASPASKHGDAE